MDDKNLATAREFLLLSNFDQTPSFRDSGHVLAEMLGIPDFQEHVRRLFETHLIQQGGELAYLLLHDPAFRSLRREHLQEAGTKVRLKSNIHTLSRILEDIGGAHFSYYVVSAAPQEIVESALEGLERAFVYYSKNIPRRCVQNRTTIAH
jgi:2-hydroxy-3-keto-5-methylthiopentenyl-1-phosphate phosphatase